MWAKIKNGEVVEYPFGLEELRKSMPDTSFPSEMTEENLAKYNIVHVIPTNSPVFDEINQDCIRDLPKKVGTDWTENWIVVPVTSDVAVERRTSKRAGMRITLVQLVFGMFESKMITRNETVGWIKGLLPVSIDTAIATLKPEQQMMEIIKATMSTEIRRKDNLIDIVMTAHSVSDQQMDDFFVKYSQI